MKTKTIPIKNIEEKFENKSFVIYSSRDVYLGGEVRDNCLKLESEVYGGDDYWDSEGHYTLSEENTKKLFSLISLDDFIALGKEKHLNGILGFLIDNHIDYECIVI